MHLMTTHVRAARNCHPNFAGLDATLLALVDAAELDYAKKVLTYSRQVRDYFVFVVIQVDGKDKPSFLSQVMMAVSIYCYYFAVSMCCHFSFCAINQRQS